MLFFTCNVFFCKWNQPWTTSYMPLIQLLYADWVFATISVEWTKFFFQIGVLAINGCIRYNKWSSWNVCRTSYSHRNSTLTALFRCQFKKDSFLSFPFSTFFLLLIFSLQAKKKNRTIVNLMATKIMNPKRSRTTLAEVINAARKSC